MHEAAITQGIIDTVLETIREHGIDVPVRKVNVTIGVCQGLIPESMQMYFDMATEHTPLAGSELVLTVQPIVAWCRGCKHELELSEAVLICPQCAFPMDLRKGTELNVSSIEVDQ